MGDSNPEIFYTDKSGYRNQECLSLGCDEEPLFSGRSPIQMYQDFIQAFADCFEHLFGAPPLSSPVCNPIKRTFDRFVPPADGLHFY